MGIQCVLSELCQGITTVSHNSITYYAGPASDDVEMVIPETELDEATDADSEGEPRAQAELATVGQIQHVRLYQCC